MHRGEVRQVEQVVDDELVMALHAAMHLGRAPAVLEEHPEEPGNPGLVGVLGLAHPDEDAVVALDHRIALDLHPRRNALLAGDSHAGARSVELQGVVVALDGVPDHLAHGQRQQAVGATVGERRGLAALGPEERHGLAEQDAAQRLLRGHFVRVCADVPVVPWKHPFLQYRRPDYAAAPRGAGLAAFFPAFPDPVAPLLAAASSFDMRAMISRACSRP